MSGITFSLAISHTPWVPARVESLKKLIAGLGELPPCHFVAQECESNWDWSERIWSWAARCSSSHYRKGRLQRLRPTHHLFLQDDVTVAPYFWDVLSSLVSAYPNEIIGLHSNHPMTGPLLQLGHHWATTSDGLVGVGYVLPHATLQEFLTWRGARLKTCAQDLLPDGKPALSEDTALGLFALTTGRRIFHPIPTPIDHDTEIASTYQNDGHTYRKSPVAFTQIGETGPWTSPLFWNQAPVHLGRAYDASPIMAAKFVSGVGTKEINQYRRESARPVIRALNYERRAKALAKPAQKVLLATPTRGGLSPFYAASIYQLLGDESLDIDQSFEIADVQMWHEDVVRVRSRFVNYFLNETDATHLLFVDSDVSFLPKVVRGMLNAKKDFVAAPYPRRDKIDFETVRSHADIPPEAAAYRYSVVPLEGEGITIEADGSGCAEVSKVALGCSLISRPLLEAMVEHFAGDRLDYADLIESWAEKDWSPPLPESKKSIESLLRRVATMAREHPILTYYDELPYLHGARVETTALFQLLLRDGALLSEDYSFCERAREMGAKVWIYLGDGSPVDHVGDFTFKGALEGFGFKRG